MRERDVSYEEACSGIVGYIINHFILLPVIGMVFYRVLPLLTTVFWFYLGRQYVRSAWKTIPAILIGNTF